MSDNVIYLTKDERRRKHMITAVNARTIMDAVNDDCYLREKVSPSEFTANGMGFKNQGGVEDAISRNIRMRKKYGINVPEQITNDE